MESNPLVMIFCFRAPPPPNQKTVSPIRPAIGRNRKLSSSNDDDIPDFGEEKHFPTAWEQIKADNAKKR